MKIVLAPDKYKGSLSSLEICSIIKNTLSKYSDIEVVLLPLADGGDGTVEVINYYLEGAYIELQVHNPIFKPLKASYLYSKSSRTAFIELAEASGIKLLEKSDQNCRYTSTYGTGELIKAALDEEVDQIIFGLGGSATNDCGIGMANALGYKFLDSNNNELKPIGDHLIKIHKIDDSQVDKRLSTVSFQIACDVTNPLYGERGAAKVYAKQKGASDSDIQYLDSGLQHFSKVLDAHFNIQSQEISGAGAAGGMGAGAVAFLNGTLTPGIDLVKQIANFDAVVKDADWIISGEGLLDDQTLSGKAIDGVVKSANELQIPVAVFCGGIDLNQDQLQAMGISYGASILDKAKDLNDAMTNTKHYLELLVEEFAKKIG